MDPSDHWFPSTVWGISKDLRNKFDDIIQNLGEEHDLVVRLMSSERALAYFGLTSYKWVES